MTIQVSRPTEPVSAALRRAGYFELRDRNTEQTSYVRRLRTNFYPRFHLYVEETIAGLRLNLHLDQKQPSYGQYTKHSGEYDGPAVETELERLRQVFGATGR